MKKRDLLGTVIVAVLVIALAVVLAATLIVTKYFVVVDFQLFRKDQESLDLRRRAITVEEYEMLAWQMPKTWITWSVPFQWGYTSSDVEELEITQLTDADIANISYLQNLRVIRAHDCTDYLQLLKLYNTYPDITVEYTVPISGQSVSADSTSIRITSLTEEDVAMMEYLPNLREVDGTRCRDYAAMEQLEKIHPDWNVQYITSIAGTQFKPDSTTLELTGADYDELFIGLAGAPNLKTVLIHNPAATSEELQKIREEYPNLEIHWEVEVFDRIFYDNAEEVDISNRPVGSIAAAKEVASKFPNLTKLIVDSDGITDEDMAAYRDEVRSDYKVVWTVYFTDKCKARTDETYFMPIKQGEYYFQEKNVYPLRFCEDMVCIDIGHSTVSTVDFAAYMPHLKYLILAWTFVIDISPLSNCKELVYLELDHGLCSDFSPLEGCTALEDLNINGIETPVGYDPVSIEPLKKLTWLKTLWAPTRSYTEKNELVEALPNTRVAVQEYGNDTGLGWRNTDNYYAMRDYLGMYYMK